MSEPHVRWIISRGGEWSDHKVVRHRRNHHQPWSDPDVIWVPFVLPVQPHTSINPCQRIPIRLVDMWFWKCTPHPHHHNLSFFSLRLPLGAICLTPTTFSRFFFTNVQVPHFKADQFRERPTTTTACTGKPDGLDKQVNPPNSKNR